MMALYFQMNDQCLKRCQIAFHFTGIQQNSMSDAVMSLFINVNSSAMKIKHINTLVMNVMSVDVAPMNKNKGTLFIAEWIYFYFIPSV